MMSTIRILFYFWHQPYPNMLGNKNNQIPGMFSNKSSNLVKKTQKCTNNTFNNSRKQLFPASRLRASASLFNRFFKAYSSFGEHDSEAAGSAPLPRSLAIASTICLNGNRKSSKCQYYCSTLFRKKIQIRVPK